MRRNNLLLIALLAHVFAAAAPAAAQLQETEYQGAAALGLALRRLGTTRRVLMIAAHPDDENTALLSELALGEGADVAYLSLTRGEGGQNLIGPELGEQLGLIRSEELLAARRLDGARQFFTRAYEFGYSKSAEETFRHWPRDSLLSDVVAVIRSFRPDILVTIFTGTPRDGHGQHQVAGILAREAFLAARDPLRFPEQLARGLRPHTVQKLFQSSWRQTNEPATVIPTGELDPLLGRSHFQIAMASRSRHRSQDMGQAQLPGPRASRVQLVARASDPPQAVAPGAVAAGAPEPSMFTGVATTLAAKVQAHMAVSRYPLRPALATLTEYETHIERVRAEYNALAPSALVPGLAAAVGLLQRADSQLVAVGPGPGMDDLRFLLNSELEDARTALARAAGLVLDAIADDERVVAGQSFGLELTLWNGGDRRVTVRSLEPVLPPAWQAVALDSLPRAPLAAGQLLTRKFSVQVPASAAPTEPYFLRRPRAGFIYDWPAATDTANLAFEPPEVRARARVEAAGAEVALGVEGMFREVHQALGELRRPVLVVPALSLRLDPAMAVLALGAAAHASSSPAAARLRYTLRLTAAAPVAGLLRLRAPARWRSEPETVPLRFERPDESRTLEAVVHAPANAAPGEYELAAVFEAEDGRRLTTGYEIIAHAHVRPRPLYRMATGRVRAFDLSVPADLRVGYVLGANDQVPDALAQLPLRLEPLDAGQLATADLSGYHAIVIGSRAYEVRPDLVAHNRRLLEYAQHGGTLIVQYQQYQFIDGAFAPYPLAIARPHDRVADETAPVRLLQPAHPAFNHPNRITAADFEGWVQERGLYFLRTWDERYVPLLETSDPGEAPLHGALLVAPYGRGLYVYTGLAFFRQLPAGVPGAYRLFANLLSLRGQ